MKRKQQPLQFQAIESTYRDVLPLIKKMMSFYSVKYRITQNAALSEINAIFLEAYARYDATKGSTFVTWFYYMVQKRLINVFNPARRKKFDTLTFSFDPMQLAENDSVHPTTQQNHLVMDMFSIVGNDARFIVKSIIECPRELSILLRWNTKRFAVADKITSIKLKAILKEYLLDNNWTDTRIENAFSEIEAFMKTA